MKDLELLALIAQDKNEGFQMLVKTYQNIVLNVAYRLLGNSHQAQDIAQEVFIKAYDNIKSFRGSSRISTWLYRITVNASYDFLRKKKPYICWQDLLPSKQPSYSQKEHIEKKEIKEIVQTAINKLPFKYKTVLVLKDIENSSYKDIAKILKCRIGTVESRLFRARKILKDIVKPLIDKGAVV